LIRQLVSLFVLLLVSATAFSSGLTEEQANRLHSLLKSGNQWNKLFDYQMKKKSGPGPSSSDDYTVIDENCEIKVVLPEEKGELDAGDGKTKVPKFSVDIQGSTCPMTAHISLDGVQLENGFDAVLEMTSRVSGEEMKKDMDITEQKTVMEIHARIAKSGPENSETVEMQVSVKVLNQGLSQKEGAFSHSGEMNMVMRITPVEGQMPDFKMISTEINAFALKDFSARLKGEVTMNGFFGAAEEKYTLNDEVITAEAYKKFRELIQLPTDKKEDQQTGPTPNPSPSLPLQCEVNLYDASVVTKAQLQDAIRGHLRIDAPSLMAGQTCNIPMMMTGQFGSDKVKAFVSYKPDFVDLYIDVNQNMISGMSFLLDEASDGGNQVGQYTYRMQCKPVPACQ
jgi:hypothetical protein